MTKNEWSMQNASRFDYSSQIEDHNAPIKPNFHQDSHPDDRLTYAHPEQSQYVAETKGVSATNSVNRRNTRPARRLPFGSMLWHSTGRWANTGGKTSVKKSFVWKYFFHPELSMGIRDLTHTQCLLCQSQLAFNTSGTTTTMLNHLKSRHGEVVELEQRMGLNKSQQSIGKGQPSDLMGDEGNSKIAVYAQAVSTKSGTADSDDKSSETWWPIRTLNEESSHSSPISGPFTKQRRQRGRPPGSGKRFNQYLSILSGPHTIRRQLAGRREHPLSRLHCTDLVSEAVRKN